MQSVMFSFSHFSTFLWTGFDCYNKWTDRSICDQTQVHSADTISDKRIGKLS